MTGDAPTVLVGMDPQQLGMVLGLDRCRMDVQVTEVPTEPDVLVVVDDLVTEEDHVVLEPRSANGSHRVVVQLLA